MLHQLFEHQAWADAELLRAVGANQSAAADEKLLGTLHHIVFVQRVFTAMLNGGAFDIQQESQPATSLAGLQERYAESHANQRLLLKDLTAESLTRWVENPWAPDLSGTVAEILMQVVLHSQNHRGQCLTRLRELTGAAPTLDFIVWLKVVREGGVSLAGPLR